MKHIFPLFVRYSSSALKLIINWLPESYKPALLLQKYIKITSKLFFFVGFAITMFIGGASP